MKKFEICKAKLDKSYTGINTAVLGQASGKLKLCGLKLYLYLCSNKDGFTWTLNPSAYADWLGVDYQSKGRTVRKAIDEGIADLIENGYMIVVDSKEEIYRFLEQKVPKKESQIKIEEKVEQIVPKKEVQKEFVF